MKREEIFWREYFRKAVERFGDTIKTCGYISRKSFLLRRSILDWIERDGMVFLDVGCGTGLFSEPLLSANTGFGIDISYDMIELAKRRGLFVAQASAFSLPFPKDSFDLVLCIEMVECVDESRDVVKELVRVAKPGASVILSAVSRSLLRLLRDVGRKRKRRLVAQEEILSIYEELGLKDIEMMEMYYYPRFTRVSKRITALSKLFSASFAIKGVKQ